MIGCQSRFHRSRAAGRCLSCVHPLKVLVRASKLQHFLVGVHMYAILAIGLAPLCELVMPTGLGAFAAAVLPRRSTMALGTLVGLSGAARAEGGRVRLKQVIAESGLEDWTLTDYEFMRDDEPRTKAYEAAIARRLKTIKDATVVDIGTGSLALLAIMAARAGARKVYAIERNAEAAKLAKELVVKAGLQGQIDVIEGDSTQVELPERVDLIVSELIGSIATQEGVEPIIKDAEARFLKRLDGQGGTGSQIIPSRVETRVAPVKYTEHRIMDFAKKRGIMSRGKAEPGTLQPLRLRSKTRDLVFLSEPQVLESFDFGSPSSAGTEVENTLTFDLPASVAPDAKDFSGFAMWTRLVVDDEHVVEVKGQKVTSHWAYVVALMADKPLAVAAPGSITLHVTVDYSAKPVRYTLEADCPV